MEYQKAISGRRLLSFALVALTIGSTLGGALWDIGGVYFLKSNALTQFSSYEELVSFLKMKPADIPQSLLQRFSFWWFGNSQPGGVIFKGITGLEGADVNVVPDYSTTNIQVEGVDEADIVKTDGEYIYLVSGTAVYLIQAKPPENATVLSKLDLNTTVSGVFVKDGKLAVIQNGYGSLVPYGYYVPYYEAKTSIVVYDISDRANPIMERNVTVDGSYFSSRMIGDWVYAVINEPAYLTNNSTVNLPKIQSCRVTATISPSSIYHPELPDYYHYFTNIVAVNILDVLQKPRIESFLLGATSCIYVSVENIYLTSPGTNIYKISIKDGDIKCVANGLVSGYVLNQFSMDENKGYFRIATSDGKSTNVYVLNENLNIVGKLEGLAPGENLHSARFMGNRCYLVTFKKVDPLFVIDLENPENPQVLGKLKIPGYSDYLHPYDETHLIGVGKETIEAENGNFAWYQGIKIALFDVSNVSQPKEIGKIVIGDRGTDSPVLQDHKAFLFSRSRGLLVLPILLAEVDEAKYPYGVPPNAYGDFVWQGAYVFNLTLEEGFVFRGRITHLDNATDLMKSGFYFYSPYSVKRALYIDDVLYTISDKRMKMNSLTDLNEIGVVELP
jgi:uncharacterized secreted protein with C-terminal beta-propeller domain